jgi:hypothetical protein
MNDKTSEATMAAKHPAQGISMLSLARRFRVPFSGTQVALKLLVLRVPFFGSPDGRCRQPFAMTLATV